MSYLAVIAMLCFATHTVNYDGPNNGGWVRSQYENQQCQRQYVKCVLNEKTYNMDKALENCILKVNAE